MLELKNIFMSFDQKEVFRDLSCTINHGDFVIIVGPNGGGKSTLFDIIAGHIQPTSGRVILDGDDITYINELHRAPFISRIFQNPSLSCVPAMTVAQNLALAAYKGRPIMLCNGMRAFPEYIVETIIKPFNLGLEKLLSTPMRSLSGGQRQIVSFIMATLVKPRIMLLDEPTAALDPSSTTKLLTFAHRYIKEHKITTILITHDPELARTLGNQVWVIEQGGISKIFKGKEKEQVDAQALSGNIDYAAIKAA